MNVDVGGVGGGLIGVREVSGSWMMVVVVVGVGPIRGHDMWCGCCLLLMSTSGWLVGWLDEYTSPSDALQ